MGPGHDELDDEIRGHMAISIQQRIARGEDPEAARLAALREFGNVTLTREGMRSVWRPRWVDRADALGHDLRIALRALLRPLVNRDEDRLIYIRQRAPGLRSENTTFSMPEIEDLRARATTVSAFGDFSTIDFTLVGFGEPRVVKAGVVGGSYFDVMGLRPALGRLLGPHDDGPK